MIDKAAIERGGIRGERAYQRDLRAYVARHAYCLRPEEWDQQDEYLEQRAARMVGFASGRLARERYRTLQLVRGARAISERRGHRPSRPLPRRRGRAVGKQRGQDG